MARNYEVLKILEEIKGAILRIDIKDLSPIEVRSRCVKVVLDVEVVEISK